MKRYLTLVALVYVVTLSWSYACAPGYTAWNGVCSADLKPEVAPDIQPSDEKPPRSGLPSWQDPGINALMLPSLTAEDAKRDAEAVEADQAGKKAAGIPVAVIDGGERHE